jgi:UDP-GlcNAc:undecaprenyl-phosphate GlcNAc-1-phosphate transferase
MEVLSETPNECTVDDRSSAFARRQSAAVASPEEQKGRSVAMLAYLTLPVLAASFLLALFLTPSAMRLAVRYELMDRPGQHKRHRQPVPMVGGAVLFVAVWVTVTLAVFLLPDEYAELAHSYFYVFAGAAIVFLVGFSDDLRPLSAWAKLSAQAAAGLVLYLGGLRIDPVSVPFMGSIDIGSWSLLITIAWVVGMTNGINLIDGLDGLAGGVSLVGALTMALIGSLFQVAPVVLLAYALVGFLLVFLWYNRYPARIFLGDSGALQIGYYFAVISLLVPLKSYTAAAVYLPLLALGVPILETAASILRRLVAGKSIVKADRRHLFHYLALAGLSPRTIVYIFWILSAIFGLFTLAMYFWDRLIVSSLLVLFMVVIFVAFFIFMANLGRPGKRQAGGRKP